MLKRAKSLVGLDIGSSAVKAVELKASGRGFKVVGYGIEPIPPDSIVDGAIIDGSAVADAIRRLFESRKIRTKDVVASLSGNAVIVKKITLPPMTEAELSESIYWEAEQYIPFDIQDVNIDYKVLDAGGGEKSTMDVLLVAAKKEKIADYTGVIAQAGRTAVAVDVDAFALQNAYQANYGVEPGQVVVLLNVGASATNINIISGDQSIFTRDISIGGNAYTEALQKELNLPFGSADALKRGQDIEGVRYDDARPVLRAVSENVMLEIQKTFDFFKATTANDRIDRIVVSGGGSRVEGFFEQLKERFEAAIEPFDPFKGVAFEARKFGDPAEAAATAAVAVGLALRRAGEKFINLLAVERERTKRRIGLQPAQKVAIAAALILIVTASDGSVREIDARSLATFASLRDMTAVRVSIDRSALGDAARVAIRAGEQTALLPVPSARHGRSHSPAEIAYAAGPLRAAGARHVDRSPEAAVARDLSRALNVLRRDDEATALLLAGAAAPIVQGCAAKVAGEKARRKGTIGVYGYWTGRSIVAEPSLKACLEAAHGTLMTRLNQGFWKGGVPPEPAPAAAPRM